MGDKSASPASPPQAQVKKENEEEIKEFAETAMNELLGWYGYEGLELRRWAARRAAPPPRRASRSDDKDTCSWCNKSLPGDGALHQSGGGAAFCSELCFSQSRRATFKRAKTCDWCRHVRHTVAYVDFQDGATQLQFCSDKCLNQYKMHIFCRETQAHLDLNPHLVNASSSSNLITPDLWLKNCKSPSASPTSEKSSSSPMPENMTIPKAVNTEKPDSAHKIQCRKSPLPLITIAPTAKLMKPKRTSEERISLQKSPESKRDTKSGKLNPRRRRISKCSATVTSQSVRRNTSTPKAQDLRLCSPSTLDGSSPASAVCNGPIHSPPQAISHLAPNIQSHFQNPMFNIPTAMYMDNIPPNYTTDRPNILPSSNFLPRPNIPFVQERPRVPPQINLPPTSLGQPPPVTVLVPYPVVLPIPLPIPIPIPIASFMQAHLLNKLRSDATKTEETEGPLDFTINCDKKREAENASHETSEASETQSNNNETKENNYELNNTNEDMSKTESDNNEGSNLEQTLPKFRITRVGTKNPKIITKARENSESSRPLRKRRRLVEVPSDDDSPLISKSRKIVQV